MRQSTEQFTRAVTPVMKDASCLTAKNHRETFPFVTGSKEFTNWEGRRDPGWLSAPRDRKLWSVAANNGRNGGIHTAQDQCSRRMCTFVPLWWLVQYVAALDHLWGVGSRDSLFSRLIPPHVVDI